MNILFVLIFLNGMPTFAQDATPPPAEEESPAPHDPMVGSGDEFLPAEPLPDAAAEAPKPIVTQKKVIKREKEAEGTQAQNRFSGDTVIKSRYTKGGRPLEVDPN